MGHDWFEHTKIAAYYLWEHTGNENALELWHAAEDIACFFEQANITEVGMVDSIRKLGVGSEGYVWFVRNIAFRLYSYTRNPDDLANWFLVEGLLSASPWVDSIVTMADMLRKDSSATAEQMRSDQIRIFYQTNS